MFNPYLDESVNESKRTKKKKLLSGDEAWHSQRGVVVVAGQLANQWAILEGHSQQA